MLFSAYSSRKNKATLYADDSELISISPPKRKKMQVSTPSKGAPCIKIEQLVKHDVWDISKKDNGAFVMKKLTENGASVNTGAVRMTARANAEQTGARPKVLIEVPKTNDAVTINAGNRLQNVNTGSTVNAKPVNAPRMEVIMPRNNVITLTPTNTQKNSVITINTSSAPTKEVTTTSAAPAKETITLNAAAAAAPKKGVITINPTPLPKKEVIAINETPPKKDVITISTIPLIRPAVLTINTKKDEEPSSQSKGDVNVRKNTMHNIWDVADKGSSGSVASASNSGPSVSGGKSDSGLPSSSTPFYSDEVYQIQEILPHVPLNVIADNLRISGSVESAMDSLLAQPVEEPLPSKEVPPAASSNDDVVFLKSVKADKPKADTVPDSKKGGAVIKIELLTRNEVWDIKMKEKEGFVLKKSEEDEKTEVTDSSKTVSQYSRLDSDLRADDSVQIIEEDDPLLDEMLLGNASHVGNPAQSNGPVKLMVYSQSSDNSPISKRKAARLSAEENIDLTMEVDSFDDYYSSPQDNASVEAFEFSDDENEEGETIEHFLFKACLVLRTLKHKNESGIPMLNDSALLNITGSTKSKDDSAMTEEGCLGGDDSEEYYTDECYTDEGD